MRKMFLALSASVWVSPALAADLIVPLPPTPVYVAPPSPTWSGLYVGGQLGANFSGSDGSLSTRETTRTLVPGTPDMGGGDDNGDDGGNNGGNGNDNPPTDDNGNGNPPPDDNGNDNPPDDNGDEPGDDEPGNGDDTADGAFGGACASTDDTQACAVLSEDALLNDGAALGLAGAGTDDTGAGAVLGERSSSGRSARVLGAAGAGTDDTGAGAVLGDGSSDDDGGNGNGDGDDGGNGNGDDGSGGNGDNDDGGNGAGNGGGNGSGGGMDDGGSAGGQSSGNDVYQEQMRRTLQSLSGGDDTSFSGGGHVGYNYQMGQFVIGGVADLSSVDLSRSTSLGFDGDRLSASQELDYLATVRLKLGYAFDSLLLYGTGGLAFGDVETRYSLGSGGTDSDDETLTGYTVGAGADYFVTSNISVGVEYLYTDLGSADFDARYEFDDSSLDASIDDDFDFHTVWAKASFYFN